MAEREIVSIRSEMLARKLNKISEKRSEAGRKAWRTIRGNQRDKQDDKTYGELMHQKRSERAKKAWETRRRNEEARQAEEMLDEDGARWTPIESQKVVINGKMRRLMVIRNNATGQIRCVDIQTGMDIEQVMNMWGEYEPMYEDGD